jgi:hypothetical protein
MILLTIAAVYFELQIVKHLKPLGWAIQKWALIGLIFSMWLSVKLGVWFGAASSAIMMAGLVSTIVTTQVYAFKARIANGNRKWINRKVKVQNTYWKVKTTKAEFKQTYRPVGKAAALPFKITYKLAMIPVNRKHGRRAW